MKNNSRAVFMSKSCQSCWNFAGVWCISNIAISANIS